MTQTSQDIIVVLSAIGGIVGIIYATVQIVKGRSKYIEQSTCHEISLEMKREIEKGISKGALEVEKIYKKISEEAEKLHEKINNVSNRVSKIEGGLKL